MVHYCCRLDAAVAIPTVEIQCVGATLVERAILDRYGCVISHSIIVVTLPVRALGNRCATLEREPFSLAEIQIRTVVSGKVVYGFPTALCEFPIGHEERSSTSMRRGNKTSSGVKDVGRYHLGSRPSGRRPGFVAVHGLL